MKSFTIIATAAALTIPVAASAHHGAEVELIRTAAVTFDLTWPLMAAIGAGFVAQVRSWFRS